MARKRKQNGESFAAEVEAGFEDVKIGHNSNLTEKETIKLGGYIREIERIEEKSREIASERGNIYKAAKEAGFDTKVLRHRVRMRRMNKVDREAFEAADAAYANALGDYATTPLGAAMAPKQPDTSDRPFA